MHISHDFIATKTCPSDEFLVVFGQVRVWDRKSAVGLEVRGCGQNFSNSCACRFKFCGCRHKISTHAGV